MEREEIHIPSLEALYCLDGVAKLDNGMISLHDQLDIHPRCLEKLDLKEIYNLTRELISETDKDQVQKLLAKYKTKYRLCFTFHQIEVKKILEKFAVKLGISSISLFTQELQDFEHLNMLDTVNPFHKHAKLLLAAAHFAYEMKCQSCSEFASYITFAMTVFLKLIYCYDELFLEKQKKLELNLKKPLTRNQIQSIRTEMQPYKNELFLTSLEREVLTNNGLLTPQALSDLKSIFEDFRNSRGLAVQQFEFDLGKTHDKDEMVSYIQESAVRRHILFNSVPESVCHYVKHGMMSFGGLDKYLENANDVVGKCDPGNVTYSVTQDGKADRFCFEFENWRSIVIASRQGVWFATSFNIKPNN